MKNDYFGHFISQLWAKMIQLGIILERSFTEGTTQIFLKQNIWMPFDYSLVFPVSTDGLFKKVWNSLVEAGLYWWGHSLYPYFGPFIGWRYEFLFGRQLIKPKQIVQRGHTGLILGVGQNHFLNHFGHYLISVPCDIETGDPWV